MVFIDYFLVSGIISENKLTKEQATEIFYQHLPKSFKLTFEPSYAYANLSEKKVNLPVWDTNEESLLHEVGHLVLGMKKGTANQILFSIKNSGGWTVVSKGIVLQAEREAWEYALQKSTGKWGLKSGLIMNYCLKSYEEGLPKLMIANYGKALIPYKAKYKDRIVQRLGF